MDHLQVELLIFDLVIIRRDQAAISDTFLESYLDVEPLELCNFLFFHLVREFAGVEIGL